jgi:hypothetical protein
MISQEVHTAEKEIDLFVADLPIWKTKRQVLLTKLMTIWRDSLKLLGLTTAHALIFNIPNGIEKEELAGLWRKARWVLRNYFHFGRYGICEVIAGVGIPF